MPGLQSPAATWRRPPAVPTKMNAVTGIDWICTGSTANSYTRLAVAPSVTVSVVDQLTVRDHVSAREKVLERDQFRRW